MCSCSREAAQVRTRSPLNIQRCASFEPSHGNDCGQPDISKPQETLSPTHAARFKGKRTSFRVMTDIRSDVLLFSKRPLAS